MVLKNFQSMIFQLKMTNLSMIMISIWQTKKPMKWLSWNLCSWKSKIKLKNNNREKSYELQSSKTLRLQLCIRIKKERNFEMETTPWLQFSCSCLLRNAFQSSIGFSLIISSLFWKMERAKQLLTLRLISLGFGKRLMSTNLIPT